MLPINRKLFPSVNNVREYTLDGQVYNMCSLTGKITNKPVDVSDQHSQCSEIDRLSEEKTFFDFIDNSVSTGNLSSLFFDKFTIKKLYHSIAQLVYLTGEKCEHILIHPLTFQNIIADTHYNCYKSLSISNILGAKVHQSVSCQEDRIYFLTKPDKCMINILNNKWVSFCIFKKEYIYKMKVSEEEEMNMFYEIPMNELNLNLVVCEDL